MTDKTPEKIIVYGHSGCWMVGPVERVLEDKEVEYRYVDIHHDGEAAEQVRQINRGYESVPTIVFTDGSTLTEPSTGELKAKLVEQGLMEAEPGLVERVKKAIGEDGAPAAKED